MDIENSTRKLLHEPRREQPHISGQADQIDVILLQRRHYLAVMLLARPAL
jgi:hypothetical protein